MTNNHITFSKLKNLYYGKRIFVIGNGPSLRRTPLDALRDEYCIAMNRISLIYPQTDWRPTFFVCITTNIKRMDWQQDILETINSGITSFVWEQLRNYIGARDNVIYIKCSHGQEVTNDAPLDWWSNDISKRVCKFGTSMLVALQIAAYLGFNEIYILGADLGFEESIYQKILRKKITKKMLNIAGLDREKQQNLYYSFDKNHFSRTYGTPGFSPQILNMNMVAAHRLAKTALEKRGIKIFNATIGGFLEVYNRVDLFTIIDE